MTVLQYADAFESFLAQIEDFDESQYLIAVYFWTTSRNITPSLSPAASIITGSKGDGREAGADSSGN